MAPITKRVPATPACSIGNVDTLNAFYFLWNALTPDKPSCHGRHPINRVCGKRFRRVISSPRKWSSFSGGWTLRKERFRLTRRRRIRKRLRALYLRGIDMRHRLAAMMLLALALPAQGRAVPNLVPDGWSQEFADAETRTRRFVSPDGRSSLTTRQTPAKRSDLRGDIDRLAVREGEQVTYQRRASSWGAVSGYRGSDIFYRKANLACDGTRWNRIELLYAREQKKAMDTTVARIAHGMTMYRADCH